MQHQHSSIGSRIASGSFASFSNAITPLDDSSQIDVDVGLSDTRLRTLTYGLNPTFDQDEIPSSDIQESTIQGSTVPTSTIQLQSSALSGLSARMEKVRDMHFDSEINPCCGDVEDSTASESSAPQAEMTLRLLIPSDNDASSFVIPDSR